MNLYTSKEISSVAKSLSDFELSHWQLESTKWLWTGDDDFEVILPSSKDADMLKSLGWQTLLVYYLILDMAINRPNESIELDALVNKLFRVRSLQEREEKKLWLWQTIKLLVRIRINNKFAEKYYDRSSRKWVELVYKNEPIIIFSPGTIAMLQSLPADKIPVKVGFTCGAWRNEFRGNRILTQYLGILDRILSIPNGQPSGQWAQCIAINAACQWRIKLLKSDFVYKRKDLISLNTKINCSNTKNCRRYRQIWNNAIQLLRDFQLISEYEEKEPFPKSRYWFDEWLNQPVLLKPAKDILENLQELTNKKSSTRR